MLSLTSWRPTVQTPIRPVSRALVVAVASVGVGVAVYASSHTPATATQRTPEIARMLAHRPIAHLTYQQVREHYSVFSAGSGRSAIVGGAHRAANVPALPANLYAHLSTPEPGSPLASIAPEPAQAVFLGTISGTSDPVWAVPAANGVVCVYMGISAAGVGPDDGYAATQGGCHNASSALSGGSIATAQIQTQQAGVTNIAFGLVPNQTTSVQLASGSGTPASIPVASNFWSWSGPGAPPTSVTFVGKAGGTQVVPVHAATDGPTSAS